MAHYDGADDFFGQFARIQTNLGQVEAKMQNLRVEATAAGGAVRVSADGQQTIRSIRIDPGLLSPSQREDLEEALTAAVNAALQQSRQSMQAEILGLTAGLNLAALLGSE